MQGRIAMALAAALLGVAPAGALAHQAPEPVTAAALGPGGCPGASIDPDRVIEGEFGSARQGSYVMVPFSVPAGTTAVRVKYCHDEPESPTSEAVRHTIDLGLWDARRRGSTWNERDFRGWGGSSHPDVTVSPAGFSTEEQYLARPKGHVPGRTTRGFVPGEIRAGEWAVELGLAAIASKALGDADGKVAWRVEIELGRDKVEAGTRYRPARYDEGPASDQPGWYAGDFHVHAEHSSLGDATMRETFDYAFQPLADGGAGLDFVTLSDYVTTSAWGEIGRHQSRYPGSLVMRSAEVITYRGHANNHASVTYADHRTGPVYVRRGDGRLERLRGERPASEVFKRVRSAGGFTQINHPTIFPSENPLFAMMCRGCSWSYDTAATDYSLVDAIEVATGPGGLEGEPGKLGPNPFTVTAIDFWEKALAAGHKIAAVGSSDSHHAGRRPNPILQSPIGQATTVVYADELSEEGIQRGIEAGHTYVKIFGNDRPDLRFEGVEPGSDAPPAIMGDTIDGGEVAFKATVLGAAPNLGSGELYELVVLKDGIPFTRIPVTGDNFTHEFRSIGDGRYRLQLERGTTIEGVTSPIYVE